MSKQIAMKVTVMPKINVLTVILITVFVLPLLEGASEQFSRARIKYLLGSLINSLEFWLALLLAFYLTRNIFFTNTSGIFKQIYNQIPANIQDFFFGQDVMTYIIVVPLLMILLRAMLGLITAMFNKAWLDSISNRIFIIIQSMGSIFRRLIGSLLQLPRAVFLVFVLGLLINFYAYYFPAPLLSRWMYDSVAYQTLNEKAIAPVINSNIARKIPVLVNDSFGRAMERVVPEPGQELANVEQHLKQLGKDNIRIIKYFNGVTLDEAIKSNSQIDETARTIVGNEQTSKKKAYLLYKWISQNMSYDYDKAERISKNPSGISSGSIIAFNTRTGICFDYSCLYISMCQAVGLKVRLISGLGYSGIAWGDHAWNQVYATEENRWINVDATFGSNGNYFDKADFNVDHRYAEVQGEW